MAHWKQMPLLLLLLLLLLAALSAHAQPPTAPTFMENAEAVVGAESGATPVTASKKKRAATPEPKPGSSGGKEAGKKFLPEIKDAAEKEAGGKCVFCGQETNREPGPNQRNTDHAVPKSRDGAATLDNAQNTCRTCNLKKGAKTTEEFLEAQQK